MIGLRGIWLIVRRSLRQHALSTAITALSVALGAGLLIAVFAIQTQSLAAFTSANMGFDAVLGARGSQLQLVLNSIYHLEQSPGNIPFSVYDEIRKHPMVSKAVPYAVGDNYLGFRLVATEKALFTDHEYSEGRKFEIEPGGRFFEDDRAEVIVGSFAAKQTGLKVGSTFHSYHGLRYDERQSKSHEELTFTVVGVLKPTNTPADRAIWMPLVGYYYMPGHALYGTGEKFVPTPGQTIPDEHKEYSAVMLKFRHPTAGATLSQTINRQGTVATLAWPIGKVLAELFAKVGWVNQVLELVAYMVIAVAAGAILASIYNTMNERRREFAILRALGARRSTVFAAIVIESATIAAIGAAVALAVYAVLMAAAAAIIRAQTGVVLDVFAPHAIMLWAPAGVIVLGAATGIVPAIKAYATDVATNLLPTT